MAANATIGPNIYGGIITTSGGLNSVVLQALADYMVALDFKPTTQLPPGPNDFLNLTDDTAATVTGGANTNGHNDTLRGGQGNAGIFAQHGTVDYVGPAAVIMVSDGSGTATDTRAGATIMAVNGSYQVGGAGSDTYLLGGTGSVAAHSGGASNATLEGGVAYTSGTADTITATAGVSTVFGATKDLYSGVGGTVLFIGQGTASTVLGGTGADTVYGDGTTFVAGTGSKVFAGDTATSDASSASTVYGGASGATTIQAGAHGDLVYLQGSADRVVSGGGTDTIWGQVGAVAPTIFGMTNSYELLESNMKGGLAIGLGANTTLDGANTTGGLTYFANPNLGNQTFIGSTTGNDSFYIGTGSTGGSVITIGDWHAGDLLNMSSFGAADQSTISKAFAGGSNLFRLSDGTLVSFSGSHPTGGTGSFYS